MSLTRAFPALEFDSPVGFEAPSDGTDRVFVVEQGGRIRVFENQNGIGLAENSLTVRAWHSLGFDWNAESANVVR